MFMLDRLFFFMSVENLFFHISGRSIFFLYIHEAKTIFQIFFLQKISYNIVNSSTYLSKDAL